MGLTGAAAGARRDPQVHTSFPPNCKARITCGRPARRVRPVELSAESSYHPSVLRTATLVLACAAGAGCLTRPPIAEEVDRFATHVAAYRGIAAEQGGGVDDSAARGLVEAYRVHAPVVSSTDALHLLDELYQTGLDGRDLTEGFGLVLEAQRGTATAIGTARIVRVASVMAPSAPQLLQLLRVRKQAALAKVDERTAVEGVGRLQQANFGVDDFIGFLQSLPLATTAGRPAAGFEFYLYVHKYRMPLLSDARVALQADCVAAAARHVDVGVFAEFAVRLLRAKLPQAEVLAYCRYVARSGSEHVTLGGLVDGYNGVEDLALPAERRLELFEGAVAALAREAQPADVAAALRALAAARLPTATLDALATQVLRALASAPSDLVADAVQRVLAEPGDHDRRAQRLAEELARIAAGGHRRPALR